MEQPPLGNLPLVDAHLDLAENATLFGRSLTSSVAEIRTFERRAERQATVSLPDLERGGIAVAFATVTAGFLAETSARGSNQDRLSTVRRRRPKRRRLPK